MTSGELLRTARRRHGVSQAQLAARAGTRQSAISRIERDVQSPTVETLARLLEVLGDELVLDARSVDHGHDLALAAREPGADAPRARRQRREAGREDRGDARTRGLNFEPSELLRRLVAGNGDFVLVGSPDEILRDPLMPVARSAAAAALRSLNRVAGG